MGASIFGRTDTERIQITDKTLHIKGLWGVETQTAFADLYLDFHHTTRGHYERSLTLNDGICRVSYEHNGVNYNREYFASYPDNVMVIKLTADKPGQLTFTTRAQIPYLVPFGPLQRPDSITTGYLSGQTQTRYSYNGRTGHVSADKDILTLRGTTEYLHMIYEGQLKVIPYGGRLTSHNDSNNDNGTIQVEQADSALILFSLGTNYQLSSELFLRSTAEKLKDCLDPHRQITGTIKEAADKGYKKLLATHQADYKNLFDRVQIDLGEVLPVYPPTVFWQSTKKENKAIISKNYCSNTDDICLSALPVKEHSPPHCKEYGTSTNWLPGTVTTHTISTYK